MKKGQLRIQEMAFVLLALALLGSLVFVVYIKSQSSSITSKAEELNIQRALSLRDKIASLPELKCSKMACVDKDKAKMLKFYEVDHLFQGLSKARLIQIYPKNEEIILFDNGKSTNQSYSTFVNVCEQRKVGFVFDYQCGLSLLVVSVV